jgi:glycosyltransferase involved in cell wall biosynthesis
MTVPELPLVSIVTPTFNSARYLEDLLRSVGAQDYPRIEHIVIDDGSTDGGATVALLRRHPTVRWWSRENRGQYATLNEGFRAATGDFITTISADDEYADTRAVGAMAEFLRQHPDCDAVHGYTQHRNEDGTPFPIQPYQRYPYWMLRYNLGFILHCSLLVRRAKLIGDDLLFDESLRYIGDADWLIRLYLKNYRFRRIETEVGAYRHHGQQVSTTATNDRRANALRLEERARVYRKYRSSHALTTLVYAYDTFQQRRVKVLGAWRRGGSAQVLKVTLEWMLRKRGGQ